MLRFDLLNDVYLFLNNYKLNRVNVLSSMKKRGLNYEIIDEIDDDIKSLIKINKLIVELNTTKNVLKLDSDHSSKDQAVFIRNKVRSYVNDKNVIEERLMSNLLSVPNIIADDTPMKDEVVLQNQFEADNHIGIKFDQYVSKFTNKNCGRTLLMDKDIFFIRKALLKLFIENNVSYGFSPVDIPCIINSEYLFISGHLPRYREYIFFIQDNQALVPTGEVILMKYVVDNMQQSPNNELLITGNSMCFRNEDTHPGQMNKPLIRMSCFEKTELFACCREENRDKVLLLMMNCAENILKLLGLSYRKLRICSKEIGSSAYIQYDLEVFFPCTGKFIEVASCSDCDKYQLVRAKSMSKYTNYVTLNCSSLAVERIIAALLERYFDVSTNKIRLPEFLNRLLSLTP